MKIVCTLLFLVSLFIQNSLLGYVIATVYLGAVITAVESAAEIHRERAEADRDPAPVYRGDEPVPYPGRGDTGAFPDLYDHGGRAAHIGVYGGAADVSGGGLVDHDIYHVAERADRRDGEAAPPAEQAERAGP